MPAKALTESSVKNIRPPSAGQKDHWDRIVPRFGLRVSYSGKKSWVITVRLLRKGAWRSPTRVVIAQYPVIGLADARERAKKWLAVADAGGDPRDLEKLERAELERQSRTTFSVVADDFLKKYTVRQKDLRESTRAEYARTLKGKDTSAWHNRPVTAITRRDIRDMLDDMVDRGAPIGANRTLAYLKRFFEWCVEQEIIDASPADHIPMPSAESGNERVLDNGEIPSVWRAFDQQGDVMGAYFKMLLLLGQRRTETAGMREDEISGVRWSDAQHPTDQPMWELPGSRSKNKLTNLVPLPPQAVEILKSIPRVAGSPYIFSLDGDVPINGIQKFKDRIDAKIAKARATAGAAPMDPWTTHNLRGTLSTGMHELGVQPHIVEAVLNHISGHRKGVAGTYNKAAYRDEKRRALTLWADHIDRLLGKRAIGNVVELQAVR